MSLTASKKLFLPNSKYSTLFNFGKNNPWHNSYHTIHLQLLTNARFQPLLSNSTFVNNLFYKSEMCVNTDCKNGNENSFKGTTNKTFKWIYIIGAGFGIGLLTLVGSLEYSVKAMTKLQLHPPHYHWSHGPWFQTLDMASVRRGYAVYKNVCVACHSLKYKQYRQLTDFMSVEEAKAEAAEIQVEDGPDEKGAMFQRPGKLVDTFPSPYPNENAARAANNGALPPDLSYIVRAREGFEDYIYSILTGYEESPPGGVTISDAQHYNPYFPGGAISMAQALYDDIIEYEDGTPATLSQLAKDVTTFLRWTSDPKFEERKRRAVKFCLFFPLLMLFTYYMYKQKAILYKTQKHFYKPTPKDKFV